ncbi:MAG: delta-60 repeat domain-containing protein [Pseudomonadota bacterium]
MGFIIKSPNKTTTIRTKYYFLYMVLFLLVIPLLAVSSPGDLDVTFANNGFQVTEISSGRDVSTSVALQSDGKLIVAGFSNGRDGIYEFVIIRYNSDGTIDSTFGEGGIAFTKVGVLNSQAFSLLIQPDGKIIAVGSTNTHASSKNIAVVRYTKNGQLDHSFGDDGITTTSITNGPDFTSSAALQLDGKIVVAAHFNNGKDNDIAVLRYNNDGSLDTQFGERGVSKSSIGQNDDEANGVVVQPDGKIIVAGSSRNSEGYYDIAAIRFNKDGKLDTTFGIKGSVTTAITHRIGKMADRDDHAAGIALQPDGKIIIVGYSYKDFVVVRYLPTGKLDETFHGDGISTTSVSPAKDEARSVVIQPDGKLVVVGKSLGSLGADKTLGSSSMDVAVVRFNSNGTLDSTFGVGGHVTTPIGLNYDVAHSAAIQPDGKLIVAGYSKSSNYNFAVLRYELESWDITPSSISFDDESNIFTNDMELNTKIIENGLGVGVTVPVVLTINTPSSDVERDTFISRVSYIGAIRTLPSTFSNVARTVLNSILGSDTSVKITAGGLHAPNNASLILGDTVSRTYKSFSAGNNMRWVYLGTIALFSMFLILLIKKLPSGFWRK